MATSPPTYPLSPQQLPQAVVVPRQVVQSLVQVQVRVLAGVLVEVWSTQVPGLESHFELSYSY